MRSHQVFGRRRRAGRLLTAAVLTIATVATPVVVETSTASAAAAGTATSLSDAFSKSPGNLLQALACPVGKVVAHVTSTIPGVNTLTNDLANILCALKILGYAYKTTYIPASGIPQVRYFTALVGVPTGLDVNGDGFADFTGTVAPTVTIPGLALTINRGLTLPASAKVSVEAFFLDPTSGSTFVGLGEDGTVAGTPNSHSVSVGAFLSSGTSVDVQLSLKATAGTAPASLATIAEVLFGTNPDAPTSIDRGSINFSPVPANFTTRLRVGPSSQDVTVTATRATTLSAHLKVIKPGDEKDVDATVDHLNTTTDVIHQTLSSGHEQTVYTASGVISHINGTYRDIDTGNHSIKVAAAVDLTSVPSAITVDQLGGKTSVTMVSGVLGGLEGRFALGQDVPPIGAGTGPYVAFHRYTSTRLTAGLRLTNIKSVSFDSSGPYVGDIVFSPAPTTIPLLALDDVTGLVATGHLSNLPAHITVTIDLNNGIVTYDGHGTGIHEINVNATKSTPFFGRATRLAVTIDDFPPSVTVNFKQTDGSVSFTPSVPVGSVSLLASDGSDAPVVTGDYASYDDTPSMWRAFAQISSIGALSFTPSPLSATIKSGSSQKMTLVAHVQRGSTNVTVNGTIDSIPTWIDFFMVNNSDGSSTVDYNSHGQVVNQITLKAVGLPLPMNDDTAYVEIDHLPSHMTGIIPAAGGTASFNPYGDHIGRVLVQVYPSAEGPYNSIPGHQTAYANLGTGQFTADIQNIGYTSISTSDQLNVHYDISDAPLDITYWNFDDTRDFMATISNPQPATIQTLPGDGTKIDYKVDDSSSGLPGSNYKPATNGEINSIKVEGNITGMYMNLMLQHIAPHVIICVDGASMLCVPTDWVDGHVSLDPANVNNIPPSFGFQLLPLDLHDDNRYPISMQLDGYVCLNGPDASCPNDHKSRIEVDGFKFSTIEAGAGNRTHDCNTYCGNAFLYFNTGGAPLSGTIKYFRDGDEDAHPLVTYHANDGEGIAATEYYTHIHYAPPDPWFEAHSFGQFGCVGSPNLIIDLGVLDLGFTTVDLSTDLLSGDFVNLCN